MPHRCLLTIAALALLLAAPGAHAAGSRVTRLEPVRTKALARGYAQVQGVVHGFVAGGERVRGLPHRGLSYTAKYELIAPAPGPRPRLLLVEAENRGSPVTLESLTGVSVSGPPDAVDYPPSVARFLATERLAYARVQWQTGSAAGVPADAQGVGEVIIRDFARRLGRTFPRRALVGTSQGAFFADTFIAEGFNAAPGGGRVFQQVLTVDGTGNWMAINQLAGAGPQDAYLRPDGHPLAYRRLLRRPRTDPALVDVANYTDFYRLRAGLTDERPPPRGVHRYDWPSPHQSFPPAVVFGGFGCNGAVPVPLNPLRYDPYLRAVVQGMAAGRLPASRRFRLGPHPATTLSFNGLPGVAVPVPRKDAAGQPRGGVRFPEVDLPLGRLEPVSLSPAVTTSSGAVCGNSGGYSPFTAAGIDRRYSRTAYLRRYGAKLRALTRAGYLRRADRAGMLAAAGRDYAAAVR